MLDAGAAMNKHPSSPKLQLVAFGLGPEARFWLGYPNKKKALLDETCLAVAEDLINGNGAKPAEAFLLSMTDQNLSDDIRPR